MVIFSLHEMKYNWYSLIKSKISSYFILKVELQRFLPGRFSFDLTSPVCLLGNLGCKLCT